MFVKDKFNHFVFREHYYPVARYFYEEFKRDKSVILERSKTTNILMNYIDSSLSQETIITYIHRSIRNLKKYGMKERDNRFFYRKFRFEFMQPEIFLYALLVELNNLKFPRVSKDSMLSYMKTPRLFLVYEEELNEILQELTKKNYISFVEQQTDNVIIFSGENIQSFAKENKIKLINYRV